MINGHRFNLLPMVVVGVVVLGVYDNRPADGKGGRMVPVEFMTLEE